MSAKENVNLVVIPHTAPDAVKSGVRLRRSNERVQVIFYDTLGDLTESLRTSLMASKHRSFHLTVYLQTCQQNGDVLQLGSRVKSIAALLEANQLRGLTLLLDDTFGLGKIGPRRLGYFDLMESQHGLSFISQELGRSLANKTTVAISGCWYDAFGHQGGYAISSAAFVEALTVHSKVFVFSTPPSPVQAAMTNRTLELLAVTGPNKPSLESLKEAGSASRMLGSTESSLSSESDDPGAGCTEMATECIAWDALGEDLKARL